MCLAAQKKLKIYYNVIGVAGVGLCIW